MSGVGGSGGSSGGGGGGAGVSRGQLLRSIQTLTNDIVVTHARFHAAADRLADETAKKTALLRRIADAEAALAALEAQKKAESENDGELVALQQANAAMATRKQELVRLTRSARNERDSLKGACAGGYYGRLGAALELERLTATAAAAAAAAATDGAGTGAAHPQPLALPSDAGGWWGSSGGGGSGGGCAALLGDADTLWKRVSTAGVTTRDLLTAALARRRLVLLPMGPPPAAVAAGAGGSAAAAAGLKAGRKAATLSWEGGDCGSTDGDGDADDASDEGDGGPAGAGDAATPGGAPRSGGAGDTDAGVGSSQGRLLADEGGLASVAAPGMYAVMGLGRGKGQAPLPATVPGTDAAAAAAAAETADGTPARRGSDAALGTAEGGDGDDGGADWEARAILADVAKARAALSQALADAAGLRKALAALPPPPAAAPGGGAPSGASSAAAAVGALLELIAQNATLQGALLDAVASSAEEAAAGDGDEAGGAGAA